MTAALQVAGVALEAEGLIALRRVALSTSAAPVLAALPGGFATRRKGHGLEVADMREYVAGDDIRHLDRGTTARTGRLHVRQFQQERDRVTLLVADFRPAMFWGLKRALRSVAAAEALALIGWNVVESGGRVGLLAVTAQETLIVPPRGRVRGMLDVVGGMVQAHRGALAAMAGGETHEDPPLEQALSRADRLVPVGAEIVVASGFDAPGTGLGDRFDALARRRTLQLVLIGDDTTRMPRGRYPVLLPDGQRMRLQISGDALDTKTPLRQIMGRSALVLDAGASVEQAAGRIAAAFPAERAA